jgi:hypothetical protein
MILDLSAVTDHLLDLVCRAWKSAPIWAELGKSQPSFTPTFTGLAPDAIRDGNGPQLSLFLYHVESDNAHESSFWSPQMLDSPGPPVRYLPFALDLFYLLSAYSAQSYIQEQEAMSVALRIFHDNALISSFASPPPWQAKLTMEHRSYDELSRLWTATAVPLRLGVVYRAAVLFLLPDELETSEQLVSTVNATVFTNGGTGSPPGGGDVVTIQAQSPPNNGAGQPVGSP